MLPGPCYIVGDTHLDFRSAERERQFVAFLRQLHGSAGSLILNGDIFDFWFEWRTVIPRDHFRLLAALSELRESGVPILMTAGNHDSWVGDVLTRDVGLEFHENGWTGAAAGWTVNVEHGDGLRDREDRRYRRIRRVLRNRVAIGAFRLLHPDLACRLARLTSSTSRAHGSRDKGEGLRAVGLARLAADPALELVVLGHAHVTALERAPGGGIYANAGSWLDGPTYLLLRDDRVELRRWTGRDSAESELLHSIDRRAQEPLAHSEELLGRVGRDEAV